MACSSIQNVKSLPIPVLAIKNSVPITPENRLHDAKLPET